MGIKCKLDYIPHDVKNVAVHLDINNEKLIYATDTNDLSNVECKNYDIYLIEGNYDEEEIEAREKEKMENGEFSIERKNKKFSFKQKSMYSIFYE